jgi:hypothetical protein
MKYAIEITDGMIYVGSFVKFGFDIQVILSLYLDNLRGCSVDISNMKDV